MRVVDWDEDGRLALIVGVIAYKLGFLIALGAPLIALAFSLGLGDTWVDWRRLLQPKAV